MLDALAELLQGHTTPPPPVDSWYRITAEATAEDAPTRAKVNIYDAIGGWWGVSASTFVRQLDALDVDELEVHINSPGGAVWDGIAIMNALRQHRARVTVVVDGLAASAASVVAMAGDEVVMAEGSQLMVHQASGGVFGNAEYIRDTAAILDKIDLNIAGIYARRTGQDRDAWLELMRVETWYNADEAVEAGLADRADESLEAVDAEATFDLSMFNYAGRSDAPAPRPVGAPAAVAGPVSVGTPRAVVNTHPSQIPVSAEPGERKEDSMDKEFLNSLRERLGVKAEADQAAILAALDEALQESADPARLPDGVVAIEQATLEALRADAAAGRQAHDQQVKEHRVAVVEAAIQAGKVPPARRDHYLAMLTADEEGTIALLDQLAPNTVPVAEVGTAGGSGDDDSVYWALYNRKDN